MKDSQYFSLLGMAWLILEFQTGCPFWPFWMTRLFFVMAVGCFVISIWEICHGR